MGINPPKGFSFPLVLNPAPDLWAIEVPDNNHDIHPAAFGKNVRLAVSGMRQAARHRDDLDDLNSGELARHGLGTVHQRQAAQFVPMMREVVRAARDSNIARNHADDALQEIRSIRNRSNPEEVRAAIGQARNSLGLAENYYNRCVRGNGDQDGHFRVLANRIARADIEADPNHPYNINRAHVENINAQSSRQLAQIEGRIRGTRFAIAELEAELANQNSRGQMNRSAGLGTRVVPVVSSGWRFSGIRSGFFSFPAYAAAAPRAAGASFFEVFFQGHELLTI
ncbi:MAG: hypothetical protein ABH859_00160 [Pseudomonadota bacterium]